MCSLLFWCCLRTPWNFFWQIILSWLCLQLAVALWGTRSQVRRPGWDTQVSQDTKLFFKLIMLHMWQKTSGNESDRQHCMRAISVPAASSVPLVGKGRSSMALCSKVFVSLHQQITFTPKYENLLYICHYSSLPLFFKTKLLIAGRNLTTGCWK